MEATKSGQFMTIFLSSQGLDYEALERTIKEYAHIDDVDCSIYKQRSFTGGKWEDGAKIEFFNIKPHTMRCLYFSMRDSLGLNCIVLSMEGYFGCIVKSPLIMVSDGLSCSND